MEKREANPRLGIQDKRNVFQYLLAMTERLLMLNRFPVDQEDFSLSLLAEETENAWKVLCQKPTMNTINPAASFTFTCMDKEWKLHRYPDDKTPTKAPYYGRMFINMNESPDIDVARRHQGLVKVWCQRQARLEDQCLRTARVLKYIVHACNTVGQYKRVSPDLITFLPEKYRNALQDYTKQSPYPEIVVTPDEIDTALSSLAFAALQKEHYSEDNYKTRPSWGNYGYHLEPFPRSAKYHEANYRNLEL